jgi:hypothetical protein
MYYHHVLSNLFEPLVPKTQVSRWVPPVFNLTGATPEQLSRHAKACLETIMRIYHLRHGFSHFDTGSVAMATLVALCSIQDLATVDPEDSNVLESIRSTIVLCADGVQDSAKNLHFSEVMLDMLKITMPPDVVTLIKPPLISAVEAESRRILAANHVRSQWPVTAVVFDSGTQHRRVEDLIQTVENINLGDGDADSTTSPGSSVLSP